MNELERPITMIIKPDEQKPFDLLDLWPTSPWEFGDRLGEVARDLIAETAPIRNDALFIEDVMRAILDAAERAGVEFKPKVDVMMLHDGSRRAVGDLPPKTYPPRS